jgi:uroporphyrinogen III methyltransferase/synthase
VTVYLVGAGPGDPGLATRRAAALLEVADVVIHDRLVPAALLELVRPGAEVIDVGKAPGAPRRQEEINALLVAHGRTGRTVVRLKGGDPFLFGRGGEEALALAEAGVAVEVVPGVSAALAAPAVAGVPVTHRGLTAAVTVVAGRVGDTGGPPVDWASLARAGGTLVILMGMERRAEIARLLLDGGRAPDTPVVVVEWGTTPAQRSVRTDLAHLPDVELGAPATIVVGAVAGLSLPVAPGGALAGRRVVVTRAADRAGDLVAALAAAGADVVPLPAVATAPAMDDGAALAAALGRADELEWLVCTSAVAVGRVLDALPDVRALAGVRLAAVGPATADAWRAAHLAPELVAEPSTAEGLVAAMPDAAPGAGAVLYPRADGARPTLATGLRAKGWRVLDVEAYRTVPVSAGDLDVAVLERAADADVVTFTSPSTVAATLALLAGRRLPPVVVCIGPVTAEAARAAGLDVHAVAGEPGAGGLVAAVAAALAGPSA